jgi:hypothetical protein
MGTSGASPSLEEFTSKPFAVNLSRTNVSAVASVGLCEKLHLEVARLDPVAEVIGRWTC